MIDMPQMLRALQFADSFFPSGALSFSAGMETLTETGLLRAEQSVRDFVFSQLKHRWASFDLPVVMQAARVSPDLESLCELDRLVEAQSLVSDMREGSKRNGCALLAVHKKMDSDIAQHYQDRILTGDAYGHIAVVQGLLWSSMSIDQNTIAVMSGHVLATGLVSAAIRLGILGHIDAQIILSKSHNIILDVLHKPLTDIDHIHTFVPMADIAVMKHETADSRLFMT